MDQFKNYEAEQGLIAFTLRHPAEYPKLAEIVKASDFSWEPFMWTWSCFGNATSKGITPDALSLKDELERISHLKDFGLPNGQQRGSVAIGYIRDIETTKSGIGYARIVRDYSLRRNRLEELSKQAKEVSDLSIPFPDELILGTPRYTLRDAADALKPQPPIDYIVDGLITNSSVNVFYGEPGSKKTYTAISLAVCVANGKPWLEFKTKKSSVLIVDEESGERRFMRRLGEALRGELCNDSSPIYFVSLAGFKLDGQEDPIILQGLINSIQARLVIFDALADIMDGDENDKKDVQPVFNHLRKISEITDSGLLVIHHSNKQGGYRGSSAIKGSVDLMVQIQSDNGSNVINFQSEKNRDGDKSIWCAEACWTESEFYLKAIDSRPADKRERESYVMRYLKAHGPTYLTDLMANADVCSPSGAKIGLYALVHQGKAIRTNPGVHKAMYELTNPNLL